MITGLVLFAYVATHLINHALGLISLPAMGIGRSWFLALWRQPVGTVALYGSLTIHFALGLGALYARRGWRMPVSEAAQIVLGLAIVPLLAEHVLGTRILFELFDVKDTYTYVVLVLWHLAPEKGAVQAATLIIVWFHGCLGLYQWLRLKPHFSRFLPLYAVVAVLIPVLALLGFVTAGREIAALAEDRNWLREVTAAINFPGAAARAMVGAVKTFIWLGVAGLLGAVLALRVGRRLWERRRGIVRLSYPEGVEIGVPTGTSVLEASRLNRIPHASVCGGRGRCSTCRIRIGKGLDKLTPPSAAEQRVLDRVAAAPNVRLACQLRPAHDLEVSPLLPPDATARDGFRRPAHLQGREQEVAILFADLRAFTRFAQRKLPYDVVFILNRYFATVGQVVEEAGGRVDKFIGDGVMALFGLETGPAEGCRQALAGARAMARALDELNRTLADEGGETLRFGIGVHAGPVIVGEMGYGRATSLTAIGDAVNTASRLEELTKTYGCQLVVSEYVATRAGVDLSAFPSHEVTVRGRDDALAIRAVADARDLPEPAAAGAPPEAARPT
ncbi:MAG: adenylate/guanylate cyclase domain-containing protein [Proteobacteria bacterium]|nr:adenylate/guanylate cyclase domain-containing protein [Pseudomonadota bacterium]